jgi:hypothetical protein
MMVERKPKEPDEENENEADKKDDWEVCTVVVWSRTVQTTTALLVKEQELLRNARLP